eukprot:NODE_5378_length_1022_cov_46.090100_g4809_i0.p1 GENE.NODE_5378_length_1022_cov_46.090100_g4809_i0~~NODE_5378_length_1022_cov_46.090100_g4809_i0.p1  ORF type:complete len:240 (+),score=34.10 NODE_5378_length_1022_cov_46.090100_g4809_i0:255-974(+)
MIQLFVREITKCVMAEEGMLVNAFGDSCVSVFGLPYEREDDAIRACRAAVWMIEYAKRVDWKISIGIHKAKLTSELIGMDNIKSFTVFGSALTLANKIQQCSRKYGVTTMLSDAVHSSLGGSYLLREIDNVRFISLNQSVTLYELLQEQTSNLSVSAMVSNWYRQGLLLYRSQQFLLASHKFQVAVEAGGDLSSAIMLQRCREFLEKPPSTSWDGCWPLDEPLTIHPPWSPVASPNKYW